MKRGLLAGLALFAAVAVHADATLTVGPGGTHTTVQGAIDAAAAGDPVSEIHVAQGIWRERAHLRVPDGRSVTVSGGWVDGFARRTDDPRLETVLDGGGIGPVVQIEAEGHVALIGFVITGALGGPGVARGVSLTARGTGTVLLSANVIRGNRVEAAETVNGGGLVAAARERSHVSIRDNVFLRNAAVSTGTGYAMSGAAEVFAVDGAFVEVTDNRFLDNEVRSPELAMVSALTVSVRDSAGGRVDGNILRGNRAIGGSAGGFSALRLFASGGSATGAPQLLARRNQVLNNVTDPPGQQVELHAVGKGALLALTGSVIAGGRGGGLSTVVSEGGTMYLTNLTVTRHPAYGIAVFDASPNVNNSILFDDGTALGGAVVGSHNLVDVDPLFVNPAADDYRLDFGSPAIDVGDNLAPWLGSLDVYGDPRIANGVVDIGADEAPAGFGRGEPPCLILSSTILAGGSVPVCRCLSDESLRAARCAFFLPEIFLVLRIPLEWKAGEPIPVDWTIHPWTPMAGPYEMAAEARVDGQWVPQAWLGPTAKGLEEGKLVVEPFELKLAGKGRTPVRTRLEFQRPGDKDLSRVTMEVLLPDPSAKK